MADSTQDQVSFIGEQNLPDGGVLIIPNFLRFHDLLLLEERFQGRSCTWLVNSEALLDPLLRAHLDKEGVKTISFTHGDDQVEAFKKKVHPTISAGETVIYIPGRAATRAGGMTSVPSPIQHFLLQSGAPVMPLFVDHVNRTRLAILPPPKGEIVVFSFGKVFEREASTIANYQESLLLAGREAYAGRESLELSLPWALIQGLKQHGKSNKVVDGLTGKETGFDKLFGAAIVLSKYIRQQTDKKRVGIVLPPGTGGLLANLAVLFAGKIPVNLNFTAGDQAVKSSIQQADLDRFITADAFVRKMQKFPWPPTRDLIFIERVLPKLKKKIILWVILSKFLPAGALANMLGIPRKGGDDEAVLLFTSGSSGEPKGVVLSHRNAVANVNQFSSRLQFEHDDSALGCLPLFHSFGCTVTMWYPVIAGLDLITYPSPLEIPKLAELIEKHRVSLFVATPTFLRGYLRKAKPEQMAPLKLVVTGAEKLPRKVAEEFERKFGKPVLEGYGLTETSPATNVNLPDPKAEEDEPVINSHRPGSTGQLLPGMAVRITDPDTDEPLPIHKSGMIWLAGPNIFQEYLHQPEKTASVLFDGWLKTGDIGRLDEDLFLYIEGRLTRFSKIAGEMVPHETLEDTINKELGVDGDSERRLVVVGIPDEAKGEAIVLLTTIPDLEPTDLRYRLLEKGIPSLWIPKRIVKTEDIPHLASGKLNLTECQKMAEAGESKPT